MRRAAFFDVGGTLIQPWPSVGAVYARVGEQFGFRVSAEAMDQAFRSTWKTGKHGGLTSSDREWWRALVGRVLSTLALPANDEYFCALYEAFAQSDVWRVYPDVVPAMGKLKDAGWHVGIISNWDARLRPLLDRLNLRFDSVTVSCEVGAEKPDVRIFKAALRVAGMDAARAFHIGDSAVEDLEGATAAGMRCALVRRVEGTELLPVIEELLR